MSPLSGTQQLITIAVVVLGTVLTRFTPYLFFPEGKPIPPFITYLGKALAPAVFGLLVVYCLRNVSLFAGSYGIPEVISMAVVFGLWLWKRNMIWPLIGGTLCYMVLVQLVFI